MSDLIHVIVSSSKKLLVFSCFLECAIKWLTIQGGRFDVYTYAIIGKDKKKAKNGALRFHKYSEWKEYVEKSFNDIVNNEDAYRFMLRRLRSRENYKELIISAVIPVEVGILTALYSAGIALPKLSTIIAIFISAIILLVIVTVNYLECEEEIEFISDFNEIVFPSKSH